ncbi:CotG/ExsB N-terminal domain-containing protein [Bacillus salipaludis]|uniref:CotG/ExsB N-terminal domain-containing protein n=1 Tax=Bacillus salipaludis TaxID=2547811 RepID=A0ABW8RN03_9BACI
MSEFTQEDIQMAADEVRRGGFGDFMFRDPGRNRGTSRRRTSRRQTSRRNTSRRKTSRNRNTSRRNTSRRRTSRRMTSRRRTSRRMTSRRRTSRRNRRMCCSEWRNTSRGNQQMKSCWQDGNMWELCIRTRR